MMRLGDRSSLIRKQQSPHRPPILVCRSVGDRSRVSDARGWLSAGLRQYCLLVALVVVSSLSRAGRADEFGFRRPTDPIENAVSPPYDSLPPAAPVFRPQAISVREGGLVQPLTTELKPLNTERPAAVPETTGTSRITTNTHLHGTREPRPTGRLPEAMGAAAPTFQKPAQVVVPAVADDSHHAFSTVDAALDNGTSAIRQVSGDRSAVSTGSAADSDAARGTDVRRGLDATQESGVTGSLDSSGGPDFSHMQHDTDATLMQFVGVLQWVVLIMITAVIAALSFRRWKLKVNSDDAGGVMEHVTTLQVQNLFQAHLLRVGDRRFLITTDRTGVRTVDVVNAWDDFEFSQQSSAQDTPDAHRSEAA